jgi:hypothetical protein
MVMMMTEGERSSRCARLSWGGAGAGPGGRIVAGVVENVDVEL